MNKVQDYFARKVDVKTIDEESRQGLTKTNSCMMCPEFSVGGFYECLELLIVAWEPPQTRYSTPYGMAIDGAVRLGPCPNFGGYLLPVS